MSEPAKGQQPVLTAVAIRLSNEAELINTTEDVILCFSVLDHGKTGKRQLQFVKSEKK